MTLIQIATKIIQVEESWRPRPYYCSEGYPTIGWGFKIGGHKAPLPERVMTREEGGVILLDAIETLHHKFSTDLRTDDAYLAMSDVRKATLISMAFQLGFSGVVDTRVGFPAMWRAIRAGDWAQAKAEALDSKVAREQTPARWARNAFMLETGALHTHYGPA